MVLNTLESLSRHNVSIANGGKTVELLRHGPSYQTTSETPETPISKRHLSPGWKQAFMPVERLVDAISDGESEAVFGAGRSLLLAGVLHRRSAALVAARSERLLSARHIPFVTGNPNLPDACQAIGKWLTEDRAGSKPATRTPPASTWGKRDR